MRLPPPIGSLLWRSQKVYQVFGANTDVGKTIFTTLLCKGARRLWRDKPVTFLKPVSTGPAQEADDYHIKSFAPDVSTSTLFQYERPVSPHIAAQDSNITTPSDAHLLSACRDFATHRAQQGNEWLFVETAGGVHSPTPSGTTQADLYTPLRLPSILIGDARLGGISQTISAFESLHMRGYKVDSVLLFDDQRWGNLAYLAGYFKDVLVAGVRGPPEKQEEQDQAADVAAMRQYYDETAGGPVVQRVLEHLDQKHAERIASLDSMAARAHRTIWWPFAQHSRLQPSDITVIDSAHGDHLQTLRRPPGDTSSTTLLLQPSFDGSASWWTQGLGHASPRLTLAAAHAAGRYGHVMFAEAAHQPALQLAEDLLAGLASPRLARVFFSDDGSTGVEVAVKMALRASRVRHQEEALGRAWINNAGAQRLDVVGLRGAYHGDTMGVMDCAEPNTFNEKTEWYEGKGFWFDYPTVLCVDGEWQVLVPDDLTSHVGNGRSFGSLSDIFDLAAREARGEHLAYEEFVRETLLVQVAQGRTFGALMIEPVVLGAGGMALVDPLFQRALVNVVRSDELADVLTPPLRAGGVGDNDDAAGPNSNKTTWSGLPVIFDEVFTGLYRLGRFSSASFLGVHPDVSVHAKLLTGGLVPLCTTVASEAVFAAFSGADKTDALLHGHSYTAHPVGCQVAVESLRAMAEMDRGGEWDWARRENGWVVAAVDEENKQEEEEEEGVTPPQQQQYTSSEEEEDAAKPLVWSVWSRDRVTNLSRSPRVFGAWALGSVLAVHLRDDDGASGYSSDAAASLRDGMMLRGESDDDATPWNVHCRVLGNVLYLMAGQTTPRGEVERVGGLLEECLGRLGV